MIGHVIQRTYWFIRVACLIARQRLLQFLEQLFVDFAVAEFAPAMSVPLLVTRASSIPRARRKAIGRRHTNNVSWPITDDSA